MGSNVDKGVWRHRNRVIIMVDSTRGVGPISNVQPGNRTQDARDSRRTEEARKSNEPVDEVEISQEALDVAAAERTAEEARAELARDQDTTLSSSNFEDLV